MTHDGMPYMVLLYYKYVPIANPERFVEDHRLLCQQLGLKGRILVAEEGINGTVAGEVGPIQQYQAALRSDQRFADLEFKISSGDASTFPKLMIKVRKEIVTLGLKEDVDPNENTGTHLSPESWKQMIDEGGDEVILFDARNRYESDVGFFEGALRPEIEHFRDLPKVVDDYAHLKGKKILMYCTGGIRCEKASALFQKEGFENVYQLHGGIVSYLEQVGRDHWKGDCFVFDQRMVVPDDFALADEPAGRCEQTGKPTRNLINCLHVPCHRLFLVSPDELAAHPDYELCPGWQKQGITMETADRGGKTQSSEEAG